MKFVLVDAASLFHRAYHVTHGDAFTKAGMALHIVFNSLAKVTKKLGIDHVVMCGEGRSWRNDYYPQYKSTRKASRAKQSPSEIEDIKVFFEVMDDLMTFMSEKTRATVLKSKSCEADDLIARFITLHPNDEHIILSGDSDMIQLISHNVAIYNGMTEMLLTQNGIVNDKGQEMVFSVKPGDGKIKIGSTIEDARKKHDKENKDRIKEAKLNEAKAADIARDAKKILDSSEPNTVDQVIAKTVWEEAETALNRARIEVVKAKSDAEKTFQFVPMPEWYQHALFVKCIRGDTGDSIFQAYPGVRYEGTSKKVGIIQAWADRHDKGFHWNNFMLQSWEKLMPDGSTQTVKVADEFALNESLIDLTKQPADILEEMDDTIVAAIQKPPVSMVGIHFLQFCGKHDLKRIADRSADHMAYLGAAYL